MIVTAPKKKEQRKISFGRLPMLLVLSSTHTFPRFLDYDNWSIIIEEEVWKYIVGESVRVRNPFW